MIILNFRYKLAAALTCLPLFFAVFFAPCLYIRASADGLSESDWYSRLVSVQASNFAELPESCRNLGNAYVNAFKSIGKSDFFSSAAEIPLSWYHILDDTTPVLSVGGQIFYFLDENNNLKFTKKSNSGGQHSIGDLSSTVKNKADLSVDGSTFRNRIEDLNKMYSVKNKEQDILSFRKDVSGNGFHSYYKDPWGCAESTLSLGIIEDGSPNEYSFYLTPFYIAGSNKYSSFSTLRIYTKNQITGTGGSLLQTLYYDWLYFDGKEYTVIQEEKKIIDSDSSSGVRYVTFSFCFDAPYPQNSCFPWCVYRFDSYTNYRNVPVTKLERTGVVGSGAIYFPWRDYRIQQLYGSSLSDIIYGQDVSMSHYINNGIHLSDHSCDYSYCDLGFVRTAEPPTFTYALDTEKVPDNYYITVGGDNIYEYNITNPATGDTTTINNYITNNYIITNPSSSGDTSGGSTVNNYYDGAIINNGDNHYYDGATINNGDNITNNYTFGNEDGDSIFNVSFGDFINNIGISIQNALNFVFVPSDGFMEHYHSDLQSAIETKIPFVNDLGGIFNSLFVDIVDDNFVYVDGLNSDGSAEESAIIYPKWTFNINFFGTDYELIFLDFSMYSGTFYYIRIVVACFTYLAFFLMLIKSLPGIIGGITDLASTAGHISVNPYVKEYFSDVPKGGD